MKNLVAVLALCVVAACSAAESKVNLTAVHICCKACVDGIDKALKGMDGVKYSVNKEGGTISIMGNDTAASQKAIDALEAAGYYGKSDAKDVVVKDDAVAADGKVKSFEVAGVHNCCGKCASAINTAAKSVAGVKACSVKAKETTFTVTGDFEPKAVLKALQDAGFHATAK